MTSWFDTAERLHALENAAISWDGTPFRANGTVKGAGVSCHHLVALILIESGALENFEIPTGSPKWSGTRENSLIEEFLSTLPGVVEILNDSRILPGDLLGFRVGKCVHHLGLVLLHARIIHCWKSVGVTINPLDDPQLKDRIAKVWRVADR